MYGRSGSKPSASRAAGTPGLTLAAAVHEAASRLAGVPGGRVEAETLAAVALDTSRTGVIANGRLPISDSTRARLDRLVSRRRSGEPLAYLTGKAPFLDFEVRVSPAVLVPRPETEALAEWAIARCAGRRDVRVLDVGTGSGALAVAIARGADARVTAVDVDPAALEIAADNARRLGVADRVRLWEADLVPPDASMYDLIVANLPYVGTREAGALDRGVRFEPAIAVFGGPDGLVPLRRLLVHLPGRLAADGDLGLEIGWTQGPAAASMLRRVLPGHALRLQRDLFGRTRYLLVEARTAAGRHAG